MTKQDFLWLLRVLRQGLNLIVVEFGKKIVELEEKK